MKLCTLLLLLACIIAPLHAATTPTTTSTTTPQNCFTFLLVPKVLKTTGEIELAALLSPAYKLPRAYLIAKRHHGSTHFTYSKCLKKFIKRLKLKKAQFKLLKTYLRKQLCAAKKDPEPFVAVLNNFLMSGGILPFTVDIDIN
ncbi:MAG: hypothetical protein LLF94_11535 [Chlamydiales bacterium]|nr:hypothetical protein [Chlamydiales bacterium]